MNDQTGVLVERDSGRRAALIDRSIRGTTHQDGGRTRRSAIACGIIVMIAVSSFCLLVSLPTNTAAETHNPIFIAQDPDFDEPVATSGVRSGDGSEGNPYIISDWEILADVKHGVDIRDTDAYFIIRNVTVSYHTYSTSNQNGIHLLNANNGTVENCTLTGWLMNGIYTMGSTNLLIFNNSVSVDQFTVSDRHGINVYSTSDGVIVDGNEVTTSAYGIKVAYADGVVVRDNNVSSVVRGGIVLEAAEGGRLWNNTMTGCGVSLWANYYSSDATRLAETTTHEITLNNTVNGNPVYYIKNISGVSYDAMPVGQLIFANCSAVGAEDLTIADCDTAVHLYFCEDVSISRVAVTGVNGLGMIVEDVDDLVVTDCTFSDGANYGTYFRAGVNLTVVRCTIDSNSNGMYIQDTRRVNVTECNFTLNAGSAGSRGIDYRSIDNATDLQSNITYNEFRENTYGLSLSKCRGVRVHHNNFIDNIVQAADNEIDLNQWDDGAEGNYWSDYSGPDTTPADGIGDVPYDIDADTVDRYPMIDIQVIPEFGHVVIPVVVILVIFGILQRKRKR